MEYNLFKRTSATIIKKEPTPMIYKILNIKDLCCDLQLYKKAYLDMSPQRQQKADRYKKAEDKFRCVFADMLLRDMLREQYGISEPEFCTDDKGKPHLADSKVHFSLSHQGDYVACVIDDKPAGIDIGQIRRVDEALIKRVCTEDELCYVMGNSQDITDLVYERFMQVWTAKEAYLKYTGEGIGGGLKSISVADKSGVIYRLQEKLLLHQFREQDYICTIISEDNQ